MNIWYIVIKAYKFEILRDCCIIIRLVWALQDSTNLWVAYFTRIYRELTA